MVVRDQMNRCLWPSFVLLSALAVPVFGRADCPVPDTGIPEDAALHIDVAGMRKTLAESGIGIGGFYAAETFGNPSGGFKQGATYDGVLELHLDGDLKNGDCGQASAFTPMAIRSSDAALLPTTSTV